jgi:hypothetical protein
MKITIKRTDEQVALIKAMASRNRQEAYDAQVALAEFVGPVVAEVINNAPTLSNLFTNLQFNADDNPSLPLDLYHDIFDEDYIKVYSQAVAGGLPMNVVQPTAAELKFATYRLDSAFAFDMKYAAKSRLDVVSKTFTRMAQEILLKQESTSANLILTALANGQTNGSTDADRHVFRTAFANRFLLEDLNKLFTKIKRINTSFVAGTPASGSARRGLSDLIVSPEVIEELRAMAYNPINTKASDGTALVTTDESGSGGIPATDAIRNQIFSQAGIPEFYGVAIMEINELGVGRKWNVVFDAVAAATTYVGHGGAASAVFTEGNEEVIIGLDRSRDSMLRAVALDSDVGSEFNLLADDQFNSRQQKIGFYGSLEEGRMVLDDRVLVGLIM